MSVEEVTEARLAESASRLASLDAPVAARRATAGSRTTSGATTTASTASRTRSGSSSSPATLTPREREVLRLRFVEDLVQREIAERVGVSQMHVSRILRDTLAHLADAA